MTRLRPARLLAGLAGAAALMLGIGWMMSPQPQLLAAPPTAAPSSPAPTPSGGSASRG